MTYTFEEAIEVLANSENNRLVKEGQLEYGLYRAYDVVGVLQNLKQEYAPTVEMTKTDKEMLLYYLENYSFYVFIDTVHTSKGNTFGLPANDDFNELSDEDLMQAWLHPDDIQIIDKE